MTAALPTGVALGRPGLEPFASAAAEAASRVVEAAVDGAGGPRWSGPDVVVTGPTTWRPVDGDLGDDVYSGAAGAAWALAHLYGPGGPSADSAPAGLAGSALGALVASAAAGEGRDGLLTGNMGLAVAAVSAGRRLGRAELVAAGSALADRIADRACRSAERDEAGRVDAGDLVAGTAGTLLGLVSLSEHPTASHREPAVRRLAARALAAGREAAPGWCWPSPPLDGVDWPPLCGLAHGATGAGLALLAAARLGVPEAAEAAEAAAGAFAWERAWFSPERSNWPDLRPRENRNEGPAWPVFWCHGAAGIGVARFWAWAATGDARLLADATAAVTAARAEVSAVAARLGTGEPVDTSLCHGLGGIVELLLVAHEATGGAEHLAAARRAGLLLVDSARATAGCWPSGLPDGRETPGLFLGLAGTAMTLARLADPSSAPSPALFGVPSRPACRPSLARRGPRDGDPAKADRLGM